MGEKYEPRISPHKVLLLGLYGSGKTTTTGQARALLQDARALSGAGRLRCRQARSISSSCSRSRKKSGAAFYGINGEKDVRKILAEAKASAKEDVSDRRLLRPERVRGASGGAAQDDKFESFSPDEKFLGDLRGHRAGGGQAGSRVQRAQSGSPA